MRGLFVTGTDTGVGKTHVSCALLRALARRGEYVAVYKPVETGCERDARSALQGPDCARLLDAAASGQSLERVATALYATPAAPLVAAQVEGERIDPEALVRDARALERDWGAVLVEGAGGLLVPIAEGYTFADLAGALDLPVLVVVGSKLGCLNHTLLTLSELERRGLRCAGYVLNEVGPPDPELAHAVATHRATLARFARAPERGCLPHLPCDERATGAEGELDVDALARVMGLGARPPRRARSADR